MDNDILKDNEYSDLLKAMMNYLDTTPEEKLKEDWEKVKEWNSIGPTVEEYIEYVKKFHNIGV